MAQRPYLNQWQLSPGLDLQAVEQKLAGSATGKLDEPFRSFKDKIGSLAPESPGAIKDRSFNCLIIGAGHASLIKTISRVVRHDATDVNLYVAEKCPELLARHLLLMSIFAGENTRLGLQERAEVYLEVFGNALVRASTRDVVAETCSTLLEAIAKSHQSPECDSVVSLKHLKHSEVDSIGSVLRFLKDSRSSFDMKQARDNTLRSYFGQRYDNRSNIFDYDFTMTLSEYPIINLRKYLEWRETGVAFKFREARFNCPNKTLCSIQSSGEDKFYWDKRSNSTADEHFSGDFTTGPYFAFGVECEDKRYFKKSNNTYLKTSEDISKFNVMDLMEEYNVMDIYLSASGHEMKRKICAVFIESLGKSLWKFEKYFDVVYVSCDMINCIEFLLPCILNENGILITENVKNLISVSKEGKSKHFEAVEKAAAAQGLTEKKDISSDFHAAFGFGTKSDS